MSHTQDVFEPTAAQQAYLHHQLDKVSRSFALVIPFLETPLRHYLATAYLLCRVVDNVEDCVQSALWKHERFAEFVHLLREPEDARDTLAHWEREAWPTLTEDEMRMMGLDGLALWQIYAQIPRGAREIIQHWTGVMAKGMSQLDNPTQSPYFVERRGVQVLESESDYDEYCYYVAGTVGHMATELVVQQYEFPTNVAAALRAGAEACGRCLQKTNIVKDFAKDLERGLSYLPDTWLRAADYAPLRLYGAPPEWTAMVLENVLHELRAAADYLLTLPYAAGGYRRASLLSLLPAYQTILLAAQRRDLMFTSNQQIKISRLTMAQCIADSERMLLDNESIRRYCARLETQVRNEFGLQVMLSER